MKNRNSFKILTTSAVLATALLFSACGKENDSGTYGAPDRWAEDPHADAESPPPASGTVGGVDPTEDYTNHDPAQPQEQSDLEQPQDQQPEQDEAPPQDQQF